MLDNVSEAMNTGFYVTASAIVNILAIIGIGAIVFAIYMFGVRKGRGLTAELKFEDLKVKVLQINCASNHQRYNSFDGYPTLVVIGEIVEGKIREGREVRLFARFDSRRPKPVNSRLYYPPYEETSTGHYEYFKGSVTDMQGRVVAVKGDTVTLTIRGDIYFGGNSPEDEFEDHEIATLDDKIEHYPHDYENFVKAYIFDGTNMDEKAMINSLGGKG